MQPTFDLWLIDQVCSGDSDLQDGLKAIEEVTHRVQAMHNGRSVLEVPFPPTSALPMDPEDVFISRIMSFSTVGVINLGEILSSIILSLNNRLLIQSALSIRSLLEMTASFVYFENRAIAPLRAKAEHTPAEYRSILDFMIGATSNGRFDWNRWTSGKEDALVLMEDFAFELSNALPAHKQTNVMTMINALEKRITQRWPHMAGRTQLHYALLSDLCHPSVGRFVLTVENDHNVQGYSVPILQFHTIPSDQKVRWFLLNTTVPMVSQLANIARDSVLNFFDAMRGLEAGRESRKSRE